MGLTTKLNRFAGFHPSTVGIGSFINQDFIWDLERTYLNIYLIVWIYLGTISLLRSWFATHSVLFKAVIFMGFWTEVVYFGTAAPRAFTNWGNLFFVESKDDGKKSGKQNGFENFRTGEMFK